MSASVKLGPTEETIFDLEKYQGRHNSYDKSKVHLTQSKIKVIDKVGRTHETSLLQLHSLVRMLSARGENTLEFIDHCYSFFSKEELSEMVKGSF